MTHINYVTFPVITQEPLNDRRGSALAREARDLFMTMVDGDAIGLVKPQDVDYAVPEPWSHVHSSTNMLFCQEGVNSCYAHSMDLVHPTDNE